MRSRVEGGRAIKTRQLARARPEDPQAEIASRPRRSAASAVGSWCSWRQVTRVDPPALGEQDPVALAIALECTAGAVDSRGRRARRSAAACGQRQSTSKNRPPTARSALNRGRGSAVASTKRHEALLEVVAGDATRRRIACDQRSAGAAFPGGRGCLASRSASRGDRSIRRTSTSFIARFESGVGRERQRDRSSVRGTDVTGIPSTSVISSARQRRSDGTRIPSPARQTPPADHFLRMMPPVGSSLPELPRRAMTEDGARAGRQHRRHPAPPCWDNADGRRRRRRDGSPACARASAVTRSGRRGYPHLRAAASATTPCCRAANSAISRSTPSPARAVVSATRVLPLRSMRRVRERSPGIPPRLSARDARVVRQGCKNVHRTRKKRLQPAGTASGFDPFKEGGAYSGPQGTKRNRLPRRLCWVKR